MAVKFAQSSPSLTTTISLAGFEFDYLADYWRLNRNVNFNSQFINRFESQLSEKIRETFIFYAESHAAHYLNTLKAQLNYYLDVSGENTFTLGGLLKVKGTITKSEEYRLSVVRCFIRKMRFLGLDEGIDDSVFKGSDQWKLSGGDRGIPVISFDPETGPFSLIEFEAIGLKAAHCYAEGKLTTEEYALLLLFKATGRRPEQIASLKVKDFEFTSKYTENLIYVLNIPRIKQLSSVFRASFRQFGLVDYIGRVIEKHIQNIVSDVEIIIGRDLSDEEVNELPLFFTEGTIEPLKSLEENDAKAFLISELPHIKTVDIGRNLIRAVDKLKITSERTGKLLHANSYRFRYTLGTRAAQEGAGTLTLATLLDHSDTQHVDVYVRNVPEYAVEISKIMNQPLARYAQAFIGKLVQDEEEANKENSRATRIPLREKECDVGSCGSTAFCQDYAPIACYLCPKFRPWVNAPHHLVLEWLMEERERAKITTDEDMAIVTINDRAIIAVCQVIKLCEESTHG
ncbi:tyrosine-type recombinase/integrase [Shewanella insulae]|uniref:site-specific integrase n=1 Tax=Shewanella insulae TaxID=2681496 RepID=UPI001EFE13B7|nr:site-specific integrase [Shewanella insulae]MCG9738300.1 tyrosine-type recombinase/integrase [Shewanella insulae]